MFKNYYGLGRRKSAVAIVFIQRALRAKLQSSKDVAIFINGISISSSYMPFFHLLTRRPSEDVSRSGPPEAGLAPSGRPPKAGLGPPKAGLASHGSRPLVINIRVSGGGKTGQKEAIILALAHAIGQLPASDARRSLRKNFLTTDARVKERKKYGLKKARKAPQYSKR